MSSTPFKWIGPTDRFGEADCLTAKITEHGICLDAGTVQQALSPARCDYMVTMLPLDEARRLRDWLTAAIYKR